MTKMSPIFILVAISLWGCSSSNGEGEEQVHTEWLKSCTDDAECGDAECICNVCTISCEKDATCEKAIEPSICSTMRTDIYRSLCKCRDSTLTGICLPACAEGASCEEGLACEDGACVPEGATMVSDQSEPWNRGLRDSEPPPPTGADACKEEGRDPDGTLLASTIRTFDRDGNLVREASEYSDGDAHIETYTYDGHGQLLTEEQDDYGDCIIDEARTTIRDSFGNLESEEHDYDGDGTADFRWTATYDENCNGVSYELDFDGDGTVDLHGISTYDDDGNLIRDESDDGADGTVDSRATLAYDEHGNLIGEEYDDGADGTVDSRVTSAYDDHGNELLREIDYDADGTVDSHTTRVYDDHGNILSEECDDEEVMGGSTDYRVTATYDDNGNMLSYEYRAVGVVPAGGGPRFYRHTYTYDDNGNLVSYASETEFDDETYGSERHYTYDEQGRLLTSEHQSPPGTVEYTDTYFYECGDEDIVECSADRRPVVPTYDAVCVDPIEEGGEPTGASREADPVVLSGEALQWLLGRQPDRLVAFRHTGSWEQVPVQVDERTSVDYTAVYNGNDCSAISYPIPTGFTGLVYADENTTVGPDPDSSIDDDDEIALMLKDAGDRPEVFAEPEGVVAGSGVEVAVSTAEDGEAIGYYYLFSHDGELSPDAGRSYGTYAYELDAGVYPDDFEFCNGPNPEDTWFTSDYYRRHFGDRWLSDVITITAPGATGVDILDMHHVGSGCASVTYAGLEGAFVTNKTGPVRAIRSYVGTASGPLTQRTHLFYEMREDIITDLRVHDMPGESITGFFDYSQEAAGMTYSNCYNPSGVTMDGVPDDIALGRANMLTQQDKEAWEMVSGEQGTLIMVSTVDTNIDLDVVRFYADDVSSQEDSCGDDEGWLGASGFVIESPVPCTDAGCEYYLQETRVLYYLEPDLSPADAMQLSTWTRQPLVIDVSSKASSDGS